MTAVWLSGRFEGDNRPYARATIQRPHIWTTKTGKRRFATFFFGDPDSVVELPNIKSVSWTRSVDQDAGTCQIELWNARNPDIGVTEVPEDLVSDQRGFYTVNRGDQTNPWGHTANRWTHRLYPDMIIRTYEGYGIDKTVGPEADAHLMPSGVWLIDDVTLSTDGIIHLNCRDATRLLMDHIAFPPVVPMSSYPLHYERKVTTTAPARTIGSTSWRTPSYDDDSGEPYYGANGSIGGHRPSDAFDGSGSTYWLSVGNASPTASYAFEWIQGTIPSSTVNAVKVKTKGGPYRVYVSVYASGAWQGKTTVPYDPDNPVSAPNGSDIPYVKSQAVDADDETIITFTAIAGATKVRLTFHDLWDSNYGTYQYRAAVYTVQVSSGSLTTASGGTHTVGTVTDYTEVVAELLAYGGFFWPSDTTLDYQNTTEGQVDYPLPLVYPYLTVGGIWGDLETAGTAMLAGSPLTSDIFDKKPLMDGITYVRDILGFINYVDETGGFVFRSPNIWSLGNWVTHPGHRVSSIATRETDYVAIDESQTLMNLQVKMSSRNTRERVVIANVGGNYGAVTKGFLPFNLPAGGYRRVGIWSDTRFESRQECQIMADLIALRQLFTYLTSTVTIPGYPAIQIDDQIKLTEEITEQVDDVHYVKGISSRLDMVDGKFTYQLDVHWLGDNAFDRWAFNPDSLSTETIAYLTALGKI